MTRPSYAARPQYWHRRPRPSSPSFFATLRHRSLTTPFRELQEEAYTNASPWFDIHCGVHLSPLGEIEHAAGFSPWERIHYHLDD